MDALERCVQGSSLVEEVRREVETQVPASCSEAEIEFGQVQWGNFLETWGLRRWEICSGARLVGLAVGRVGRFYRTSEPVKFYAKALFAGGLAAEVCQLKREPEVVGLFWGGSQVGEVRLGPRRWLIGPNRLLVFSGNEQFGTVEERILRVDPWPLDFRLQNGQVVALNDLEAGVPVFSGDLLAACDERSLRVSFCLCVYVRLRRSSV